MGVKVLKVKEEKVYNDFAFIYVYPNDAIFDEDGFHINEKDNGEVYLISKKQFEKLTGKEIPDLEAFWCKCNFLDYNCKDDIHLSKDSKIKLYQSIKDNSKLISKTASYDLYYGTNSEENNVKEKGYTFTFKQV